MTNITISSIQNGLVESIETIKIESEQAQLLSFVLSNSGFTCHSEETAE